MHLRAGIMLRVMFIETDEVKGQKDTRSLIHRLFKDSQLTQKHVK
jgi:hypothetical protein